jgi:hypothetical protein
MSALEEDNIMHPKEIHDELSSDTSKNEFSTLEGQDILSTGFELENPDIGGSVNRYATHYLLIDLGEKPQDWIDDQTRSTWKREDRKLASYRVYEWEMENKDVEITASTYQTPIKDSSNPLAAIRETPPLVSGDIEKYRFKNDIRKLEGDYHASIQLNRGVGAQHRAPGS